MSRNKKDEHMACPSDDSFGDAELSVRSDDRLSARSRDNGRNYLSPIDEQA